jgi:peptidoglycan hydrolase-like protein with peptidoglycan-binding domain
MVRERRRHRLAVISVGLSLVAAACSGGEAEPTLPPTTLAAPTTTSSTSSTTSTIPLIANGPAITRNGDRNETAEALQFLINCNGYAQLTVDGAFGPATEAAVEAVQEDMGREVTGAPDDATFADLSRGCSEDRRVSIDEDDDFEQIVVGNAAGGDTEIFFIRASEDERMSVVLETENGGAVVSVRTAGGRAVGTGGTGAWAADITETGDYVIEVSAAEPTTFVATIALVELDLDEISAAPDGRIVVDDLDSTVTSSCLDTNGDASYVAETALGSLVLTTGRIGTYALDRGGVAAAVEYLFADGSPGYYGFDLDLDIEVGDQVVGTATVFVREPGSADDPREVSFDFDRPVAPCEGGEGTTVVLRADGLGVVDFGAEPDGAIGTVRSALLGASPNVDSDWVTIDNLSNEFGVCRQGTTQVRSVAIDNLTMFFTDAGTSFAEAGTRHFAGFIAEDGVFPFQTSRRVGVGDTLAQVLVAHEDATVAAGFTGGIDAYLSSPPGSDEWLRLTATAASDPSDTEAIVDVVTGGRFCDN